MNVRIPTHSSTRCAAIATAVLIVTFTAATTLHAERTLKASHGVLAIPSNRAKTRAPDLSVAKSLPLPRAATYDVKTSEHEILQVFSAAQSKTGPASDL